MAKYILTNGKHSGFDDKGARKLYKAGEIIDLDENAAKNMVGKVMSVEEYQARQKIEKARADAEARVQAEIDAEHEEEQRKAQAAVDAAAKKAGATGNSNGGNKAAGTKAA